MKVKLAIHKRHKTTFRQIEVINYYCNKESSFNQV